MWSVYSFFYVLILAIISRALMTFYNVQVITEEEAEKRPDVFSGERAFNLLRKLNDVGSKESSSYNCEVVTLNILRRELQWIQDNAHENQKVSFFIQNASGRTALNRPIQREYRNVQNIVAVLKGEDESHYVLTNCHFDSTPGSPGASDDLSGCAVMMESLRVLSRQAERSRFSYIFLFNAAEEFGLLGSQGFLRHYDGAENISALINLESAGSGGKEMLFQVSRGHQWLINHFGQSVRTPNGQTFGNEVFESGIIPSGSDFVVFQNYQDENKTISIPGFDFAHFRAGYRYHTKNDHIKYLTVENMQYTGNNILGLVKSLANAKELPNPPQNGSSAVYFDYLGLFFVSYSDSAAVYINVIVSVLSIVIPFTINYYFDKSRITVKILFYKTLMSAGTALLGLLISVASCLLLAWIFGSTNKVLRWYTHTSLIVGIYGSATLLVNIIVYYLSYKAFERVFSVNYKQDNVKIHINGVNVLLAILVLGLTYFGIQSQYILMLFLVFSTIAQTLVFLVEQGYVMYRKIKHFDWEKKLESDTSLQPLIAYYIGLGPLVLWGTYVYHITTEVFVPITARNRGSVSPDIMIGLIAAVLLYFVVIYFMPLVAFLKRKMTPIAVVAGVFVLSLALAMFTPFGFPFSGDESFPTPQRHFITHTRRDVFDNNGSLIMTDSGFMYEEVDHLTNNTLFSLHDVDDFLFENDDFCPIAPFCGYAQGFKRTTRSYFLPTLSVPAKIRNSELQLTSQGSRLHFSLKGSTFTDIYIMGGRSNLASNIRNWNGREVELVNFIYGSSTRELTYFYVRPNRGSQRVVITVATKDFEIRAPGDKAPLFEELLAAMPDWTFSVTSNAHTKTYIYDV